MRRIEFTHHDLDVIIHVTGFDAGVGAIKQIDIRGRGGPTCSSRWRPSPRANDYKGFDLA